MDTITYRSNDGLIPNETIPALLMLEDCSDRYLIATIINKYPGFKITVEVDARPKFQCLGDFHIKSWKVNRIEEKVFIYLEELEVVK